MRRIENQSPGEQSSRARFAAHRKTQKARWTTLAATLLVAAIEALAQEKQADGSRLTINGTIAAAQDSGRPARRIIVSVPDRKLALMEDGRVLKTYPVAVGATASPTPSGEFKIAHRILQPTYYAPGKVIPPGKANPLGTRWIGLSQKGYGIHGTNEPRSIGRSASHGCIRMRNRDVEELFEMVRVGHVVELRAERTTELTQIFNTAVGPAQTVPAAAATEPAVGAAASGQY